jgi:hypothetical protein
MKEQLRNKAMLLLGEAERAASALEAKAHQTRNPEDAAAAAVRVTLVSRLSLHVLHLCSLSLHESHLCNATHYSCYTCVMQLTTHSCYLCVTPLTARVTFVSRLRSMPLTACNVCVTPLVDAPHCVLHLCHASGRCPHCVLPLCHASGRCPAHMCYICVTPLVDAPHFCVTYVSRLRSMPLTEVLPLCHASGRCPSLRFTIVSHLRLMPLIACLFMSRLRLTHMCYICVTPPVDTPHICVTNASRLWSMPLTKVLHLCHTYGRCPTLKCYICVTPADGAAERGCCHDESGPGALTL